MPPRDALAGLALMLLAYRRPPTAAALAVACRAPCRAAYATTAEAMHLAAVQLVAEVARDCRLHPWAAEDDPDVIDPEGFEAVNWRALAEMAGEPLDLDGWRRWAGERFADPEVGAPCENL